MVEEKLSRAVEFDDRSLPPIKTANGSPRACLCPNMLRLRDVEVNGRVLVRQEIVTRPGG